MRFTIDFIEIFAEKADREAPSKMPIHPRQWLRTEMESP